nr:putative ribonuclease H-like domain-containing protein [Tanacetum cinerariifolium]
MAFLSSPGSTNEVDTSTIQVSTVSIPVSTVSSHDNTDNLSDATVWDILQGSVEVLGSRKTVKVEDTSSKAIVAINGAGFDWSYMADDEVSTNMALMAFSDSEDNKSVYIDTSNEIKKDLDALIIKDWVFDSDEDESEVMVLKSENVQHKLEQANQPRKVSQDPRNNRTNWNEMRTRKLGVSTARQSSSRAAAPVSASRPINTAAPKPLVNVEKPRQNALQKSHSLSRRPFYQQTTLKNRNLNNKINTAKVQDHVSKNSGSYICKRFDYVDPEGIIKHMTGNISYLTDFKEHDGGYVAFGRGAKGGNITDKGTIRIATKDETSRILKSFITKIENLVDKKVKIIRCDNGTEFKNRVMNEFYKVKGINREYSMARTPQQNRVAEERNRTLIEAARTMLADSKLPTTF